MDRNNGEDSNNNNSEDNNNNNTQPINLEFIKELPIALTRTDITFPISRIGGSKIKSEILLYNLNKWINENDVTFIDYTQKGTNEHVLEPINDIFSDNIILYFFIDRKTVENERVL
jgi:hypothetical protein